MSGTLPHNATVLDVDYNHPEKTFPIIVIRNEELNGLDGKTYYKGYTTVVQGDQRWTYDDKTRDFFSARIWSNDSILVGIPSMPYDMCHFPEVFTLDCGKGAFQAMDAMRNRYLRDTSRHIKYFLLKFPTPSDSQFGKLELSTKAIYDNFDGDETELELIYPEIVVKHAEVQPDMHHQFAAWNVVRLDVEMNKRGRPDTAPKVSKAYALRLQKAADALAAQLAAQQGPQGPQADAAMS